MTEIIKLWNGVLGFFVLLFVLLCFLALSERKVVLFETHCNGPGVLVKGQQYPDDIIYSY